MPRVRIRPQSSQDDLAKIFGPQMRDRLDRASNMAIRWAGKKMQENAVRSQIWTGGKPLTTVPGHLFHRSQDLGRSVYYEIDSRPAQHTLWFGAGRSGPAASYAHVHEQQGKLGDTVTVHAKPGKWLKIPVHPKAVTAAGRPSKAGFLNNLDFIQVKQNLAYLVQPKARSDRASLLSPKNKIVGRVLFMLVRKVVIPSRPFLLPAIMEVLPKLEQHYGIAVTHILAGRRVIRRP